MHVSRIERKVILGICTTGNLLSITVHFSLFARFAENLLGRYWEVCNLTPFPPFIAHSTSSHSMPSRYCMTNLHLYHFPISYFPNYRSDIVCINTLSSLAPFLDPIFNHFHCILSKLLIHPYFPSRPLIFSHLFPMTSTSSHLICQPLKQLPCPSPHGLTSFVSSPSSSPSPSPSPSPTPYSLPPSPSPSPYSLLYYHSITTPSNSL